MRTPITRRGALKTLGASGTFALAGCIGETGGGSNETVLLGQPTVSTSKWDFLQPAVTAATEMTIQEVNDAGGPLGNEMELKQRETALKPQQARTVVQQFKNNDEATVVGGLLSSEVTPLVDFLSSQEIPIVSNWLGTTAVDGRGGDHGTPGDLSDDEWIWRTQISDSIHTAGAAQKMVSEGYEKVAILNGTAQGERSWADAFEKWFTNGGGEIVNRVEVEEGKSTYKAELDRLFEADFDAWGLATGLNDVVTILREWSNAGYGGQLILEDALRDEALIENAGEQAEGAWIASPTGQGPAYDAFEEKYKSYQSDPPALHAWAVTCYDMVNVVALAAHRAGTSDPKEVEKNLGPVTREGGTTVSNFADGKEALDNGDEVQYRGAATPCTFTDYGNVLGDVAIERVTPSAFEQVDVVPASDIENVLEEY
ncbi:ABC transporter substrate-binding protein [Haloferax sp. YSMS24]|uniref:ABC transporter substrate-binding protein n=1 Tax=Haloferax sp. YSMS24 TaxID=3388425 RepID=UPI00398CFDB4